MSDDWIQGTLAIDYDYEPNQPPAATPTSWFQHLYDVPVLHFQAVHSTIDEPVIVAQTIWRLNIFDAAREALPTTADGAPPRCALFRNAENTAWLVVQLDGAGVAARVIERRELETSTETRCTTAFLGTPYRELRDVPMLRDARMSDDLHLLAAYFFYALGWLRTPADMAHYSDVSHRIEHSIDLARAIDHTLQLSATFLAATDALALNVFVDIAHVARRVADLHVLPSDAAGALRRIYPAPADRQRAAFAALLVETLFDRELTQLEVLDPLDWPEEMISPAGGDIARRLSLESSADSVGELLRSVYTVMVPLRAVLSDAYRHVMRVVSVAERVTNEAVARVARRLSDAEPIAGLLVLTPGVVELYQLFRYGARTELRCYSVTASAFAARELLLADRYDPLGHEPGIEEAVGSRRVVRDEALWVRAIDDRLRSGPTRSSLGLIAPLRLTLERMARGTARTEQTFYILGLLALARWLADIERQGRDADRYDSTAARAQLAAFDADERKMVVDAGRYLFE